MYYRTHVVGNFHAVKISRFFELGETPTHQYFTFKACGVCGFLESFF